MREKEREEKREVRRSMELIVCVCSFHIRLCVSTTVHTAMCGPYHSSVTQTQLSLEEPPKPLSKLPFVVVVVEWPAFQTVVGVGGQVG